MYRMFPLRFIETLRCLNSEHFQLYVVADPTGLVINVFHRVVVVLHSAIGHSFIHFIDLSHRRHLVTHIFQFFLMNARFNFAIYPICGRVPLLFLYFSLFPKIIVDHFRCVF